MSLFEQFPLLEILCVFHSFHEISWQNFKLIEILRKKRVHDGRVKV